MTLLVAFKKLRFQNAFRSQENEKPPFSEFLQFEERFRKPPFLRQISVGGRPNGRKKAAFSNSVSSVVKTVAA